MGVDAGDFDNDGDEDLFVTELIEPGQLAVRQRRHRRSSKSRARGSASAAQPAVHRLRHGLVRLRQRRLARPAHGERRRQPERRGARPTDDPFPLQQRKQLFRNLGDGRFEDVTDGPARRSSSSEVGRGAAFGDIDNDGDTDVLVGNGAGPTRLLINNIGNRNHWLGLRLVEQRPRRDMVGARVGVVRDRRPDAVAARPSRRQLRVGQRSSCARRTRPVGRRSRACA